MFSRYKQCHIEVNYRKQKIKHFFENCCYDSDFVELKYKIKVIFARHYIVLNVYATWLDKHAVQFDTDVTLI